MTPESAVASSLLVASGVSKRFGALVVLDAVDFTVGGNESVGIVGPNGAGKTTLMAVLAGAHRPSAGTVTFGGLDVTGWTASQRCRKGLARTHQIPKPFTGLTTFENVFAAASHGAEARREEAYAIAVDALRLCGMMGIANRRAESLGLLDRKRLELARALATKPSLLLLDEIGGGLTDAEAGELVDTIRELRHRRIGIVWIEHIVHVLLQVVERLVCMDAGRVIADGDPKLVMSNPAVMAAYLGRSPA